MTWAMLASLLAQFGPAAIDIAKKIIEKWNSTDPVTLAELEELKKMSQRTSKDALIAALLRNNVPIDSEQAKALLAMV